MARPSKRQVRRAIKRSTRKFTVEEVFGVYSASSGMSLDGTFYVPDLEAVKLFLQWSKADDPRWLSDRRDCDNFAAYLFGQIGMEFAVNPIALVWDYSGRHAYNGVLYHEDGDLRFALIEPQTDGFVVAGAHPIYEATEGEIIFG